MYINLCFGDFIHYIDNIHLCHPPNCGPDQGSSNWLWIAGNRDRLTTNQSAENSVYGVLGPKWYFCITLPWPCLAQGAWRKGKKHCKSQTSMGDYCLSSVFWAWQGHCTQELIATVVVHTRCQSTFQHGLKGLLRTMPSWETTGSWWRLREGDSVFLSGAAPGWLSML